MSCLKSILHRLPYCWAVDVKAEANHPRLREFKKLFDELWSRDSFYNHQYYGVEGNTCHAWGSISQSATDLLTLDALFVEIDGYTRSLAKEDDLIREMQRVLPVKWVVDITASDNQTEQVKEFKRLYDIFAGPRKWTRKYYGAERGKHVNRAAQPTGEVISLTKFFSLLVMHRSNQQIEENSKLIPKAEKPWTPETGDWVKGEIQFLAGWKEGIYMMPFKGAHIVGFDYGESGMQYYECSQVIPAIQKVRVTLAEIAEWKGVQVDQLEISHDFINILKRD